MNTFVLLISISLVAINEAGTYGAISGKRRSIGGGSRIGVFERGVGGVNQGSVFGEGFVRQATGEEGFGTVTGQRFDVAGGQRGIRRGLIRKGIFTGVSGQAGFGSEFGVGSAAGGVDITSGVRGVVGQSGVDILTGVRGVVGQPGVVVQKSVRGVAVQPGVSVFAGAKGVAVQPGVGVFAGAKGVAVQPGVGVFAGAKGVAVQPGVGVFSGASGVAVQKNVRISDGVGQPGLEGILTGRTTFGERVSGQTGFSVGFDGRTSEQGILVGGISGQTGLRRGGGQSRIIKKSGYGSYDPRY